MKPFIQFKINYGQLNPIHRDCWEKNGLSTHLIIAMYRYSTPPTDHLCPQTQSIIYLPSKAKEDFSLFYYLTLMRKNIWDKNVCQSQPCAWSISHISEGLKDVFVTEVKTTRHLFFTCHLDDFYTKLCPGFVREGSIRSILHWQKCIIVSSHVKHFAIFSFYMGYLICPTWQRIWGRCYY